MTVEQVPILRPSGLMRPLHNGQNLVRQVKMGAVIQSQ